MKKEISIQRRHPVRNVAKAAYRAKQAPAHIKQNLKAAGRSYTHSLTTGGGLFVVAGIIGVAAFAILTAGIVVLLNALVGSPLGYFLAVLGYLLVAGIIAAVGKNRSGKHHAQGQEHVQDARSEIKSVTRPLRIAFGKNGR